MLAPFWFTKTFRSQECGSTLEDLSILTFQWYRKKVKHKIRFFLTKKKIKKYNSNHKMLHLFTFYHLSRNTKQMFEQLDKFDKFSLTKQNSWL